MLQTVVVMVVVMVANKMAREYARQYTFVTREDQRFNYCWLTFQSMVFFKVTLLYIFSPHKRILLFSFSDGTHR